MAIDPLGWGECEFAHFINMMMIACLGKNIALLHQDCVLTS
jgi:hypothetical protein